jgi:hypothetical protein
MSILGLKAQSVIHEPGQKQHPVIPSGLSWSDGMAHSVIGRSRFWHHRFKKKAERKRESAFRYRKAAIIAIVVTLALWALPSFALKPSELTDEENEARLLVPKKFPETRDAFFPMVNLTHKATLPKRFPFVEFVQHTVVDATAGDDEPLPLENAWGGI